MSTPLSTTSAQAVVTPGQNSYVSYLSTAWQQHLAPREQHAPTVVSTFAGVGGSSLGYSMAGYRPLLAVEWSAEATATYRRNFPSTPCYQGDIATLTSATVQDVTGLAPGQLDVLDGSPPCQGFSVLVTKRYLDDPRNQLFREYTRLLRDLQPKVFVMENVKGMVKGSMKILFAEILRELKACGYQVSARLMSAQYFHVPQHRERMIFIGTRNNLSIKPSHPAASSALIPAGAALEGVTSSMMVRAYTDYEMHAWKRAGKGGSVGKFKANRKVDPGRPCQTIRRPDGCVSHWSEPRYLSVEERAVLSSFPLEYQWLSVESAMNGIGNCVPPLFMRSIARHIRENLL